MLLEQGGELVALRFSVVSLEGIADVVLVVQQTLQSRFGARVVRGGLEKILSGQGHMVMPKSTLLVVNILRLRRLGRRDANHGSREGQAAGELGYFHTILILSPS